jgi:N-acyl-L-homoserine lactone synthetase
MIILIEKNNAHKYSNLVDKMHRLRARIFHDRLGWDVRVVDGKERDKYDDEGPVYIIYADDEAREVKGSMRLLPTTGPTLLADCFADTLPDAALLSAPTIWEATRFCIDDRLLDRGSPDGLFFASSVMIAALGDVAVRAGIESIVANFDASALRLYRRVGCEIDILGCTLRYGLPVYLGLFPVSESLLRNLKRRLANAHQESARTEKLAA